MSPARSLVVNADDFGLCSGVNSAVKQLYEAGAVTSVSLLANGEAAEEAAALAKEMEGLSVGLHLCLVEEKPMAPVKSITRLAPGGKFPGHAKDLAVQLLGGGIPSDEIERELDTQLTWALDHGLKLTHLDGHQHVHILPQVAKVVAGLTEKYKIPVVRNLSGASGALSKVRRMNPMEEAGVRLLAALMGNGVLKPYTRLPVLFGLQESGHLSMEALEKVFQTNWSGTAELMVHPGITDTAYQRYSHWDYDWQGDFDTLMQAGLPEMAKRSGVRLTNSRG